MKNIQCKTHALTYNCYIFPSFQLSGHPSRKITFNETNISIVIHRYLFTNNYSILDFYISKLCSLNLFIYIFKLLETILLHHRNHFDISPILMGSITFREKHISHKNFPLKPKVI